MPALRKEAHLRLPFLGRYIHIPSWLDVQLGANSPKLSAVRTRFFSEPGMNNGVGDLVEDDLPYVGFVTHCKQAR